MLDKIIGRADAAWGVEPLIEKIWVTLEPGTSTFVKTTPLFDTKP
jgi:hypothetical protein